MHLLPCPECETEIPVAPSQAGDSTTCPQCQADVEIPKLGDLRKLPSEELHESPQSASKPEVSGGLRAGFLLLAVIALGSFLIAGYCGIRWSLIEVSGSTDDHIVRMREEYATVPAARLIREYEQMEEDGIDLGLPFRYKQRAIEKSGWGNNASIATGVGILAILGALGLTVVTRSR